MSFVNDPTRLLVPLVKITAYSKVSGSIADQVDSVMVPYDMTSLKSGFANCVKSDAASGGDGAVASFNYTEPSEMQLKLLLDDTTYSNIAAFGLPANLIPDSVDKVIQQLITMCVTIDGDSHQPNFVRVTPLQMPMVKGPGSGFGGFVSSLEVTNDIVDMLGNRMKATVDIKFTECKDAKTSDKEIGRSSPDLTHIIQTFAGDKFVDRVNRIYGEPRFVHSVAEFNELNTVRRLKVGDSVKYPPLDQ